MLELRPYQTASVQELRVKFSHGLKRLVLYLATGGGKTLTALFMVMAAVAKGKRVMFVCNRKHLVNQASKVFFANGVGHGIVQAENTRDLHENVIVASIQSLATRGMPTDVGLVIFDEAHFVAGSKQARELLFQFNAVPVIGLSATPFSKGMGKHYDELRGPLFQDIVAAVSISELIELGFLVDLDIYAPSEPDMSKYKTTKTAYGDDYSDKDAAEAADTPKLVGDIVAHWCRLAHDTPTVVFAASIAHSRHIVAEFQKAGISAEHIDAYTDDDERHAVFERFNNGDTRVLSNVGVLCEGWDAPHCRTMILARPTRSLIRYIQMAGRILRPFEGKDRGLLLDHSGSVTELGFPTDDLPLELDDGTAQSSKAKTKEKEEPKPRKCPECSFVKPAGTAKCPQCGFVAAMTKPVETVDGELLPVKGGKRASIVDKQATYSGLLWYARTHNRKEGWAAHKYREIFGVWPKGIDRVPKVPAEALFSWIKSQDIRYARSRNATR